MYAKSSNYFYRVRQEDQQYDSKLELGVSLSLPAIIPSFHLGHVGGRGSVVKWVVQ